MATALLGRANSLLDLATPSGPRNYSPSSLLCRLSLPNVAVRANPIRGKHNDHGAWGETRCPSRGKTTLALIVLVGVGLLAFGLGLGAGAHLNIIEMLG
jgi:hypothetical protein